jgi:toxin ParE1/3/4
MVEIIWRPEAHENLMDVFLTIAEDNVRAAERVVREIEERVRLLARNPRMGVRRPWIGSSARILVRGVYVIVYEIKPDTDDGVVDEVDVISIVHGHRDMTSMF